ncbi:hypothetical protein BDW22DRAFT_1349501 [Trametopsis cervina]|nr:hypothetical protein BDW22DRAFT_1349501 [Trametopsis cervina]
MDNICFEDHLIFMAGNACFIAAYPLEPGVGYTMMPWIQMSRFLKQTCLVCCLRYTKRPTPLSSSTLCKEFAYYKGLNGNKIFKNEDEHKRIWFAITVTAAAACLFYMRPALRASHMFSGCGLLAEVNAARKQRGLKEVTVTNAGIV